MKNLKLRAIVSGIIIILSSTHLNAMEEKSITGKVYDGAANVMGALYTGGKRLVLGNSGMLEQELDTFDPQAWDDVNTGNLVNRAVKEIAYDPKKTTDLLLKIKNHNDLYTDKPYAISDTAKAHAKTAVERHYKTKEQETLDDTENQMHNLLNSFRRQYQAIIKQSDAKKKELAAIAEIIILINAKKPDTDLFARMLEEKRTLPNDLCAFLQKSDLEDEPVHVGLTPTADANTKNPTTSSLTANPSDANTKNPTTSSLTANPSDANTKNPTTSSLTANPSDANTKNPTTSSLTANPSDANNHSNNINPTTPAVVPIVLSDANNNANASKSPLPNLVLASPLLNSNALAQPAAQRDEGNNNNNDDDNDVVIINDDLEKKTENNAAVAPNTTNNNNNNKSKKNKKKNGSNNSLSSLENKNNNNNKSDDDND